ncbi:MAG: hypothetical protein U1F15_04050 [Burkholderiales bacterium]
MADLASRLRAVALPLWRGLQCIALAALCAACGTAAAQFTFRWDASVGYSALGSSGSTPYFSAESAAGDLRSFAYQGNHYWSRVDRAADPNLYYNPFLQKSGYAGQGVVAATVDEVCIPSCAANCSGCYYTGVATPTAPGTLVDWWSCQCQQATYPFDYFPMPANAYCAEPGFSWTHGGSTAYVSYWRQSPPARCQSSAYGHVYANNHDPLKADNACHAGNPTHPALGNKTHRESIYRSSADPALGFDLYYSTNMYDTLAKVAGWGHTYARVIAPGGDTKVYAYRENGSVSTFNLSGGIYVTDADLPDRLTRLTDGGGATTGWTFANAANDELETYNASGLLISIVARSGKTYTLTYSDATTPPAIAPFPGLLAAVTDAFGRQLGFTYTSDGRIATLTDPAGRTTQFGYDAAHNLASITWPDGRSRQFVYENATYISALTGIVDENASRFATYSYDVHGRIASTTHAGAADTNTYVYNANGTSTITDPLGTSRTLGFTTVLGNIKPSSVSQPCLTCGGQSASATTYDANGNVASRTDFNNKKVCYSYDLARNLETARVEGLYANETCSTALASPPNRPDVRKVTTTWHATFRLPATTVEPAPGGSRTTTFTYDTSGNLAQKSIVAPKNDGTGSTVTRTSSWTYGTLGRVATATDPNGRVTTYAYNADNDANLGKRGNVQTITNPLGHVTQIAAYDADGRPLTVVDANALTTTMTYDLRGRLISRTVGSEQTSYVYDGVGQLTGVVLPDNSTLTYTYDAAHRLTQLQDGLGNRIAYTLDGAGNRTQERVYDPGGVLARTRSRVFDALNRLAQDLGAQAQATAYSYDGNGNLTGTTDPLSHSTTNTYDALNRLTQVLDPAGGTTQYAYDAGGNLAQVTDPRGLATAYTYDGLGNLTKQVSPDTGTTTSTFDAAGNVLTRTDARGATATYTLDALNRATAISYTKSGTPARRTPTPTTVAPTPRAASPSSPTRRPRRRGPTRRRAEWPARHRRSPA